MSLSSLVLSEQIPLRWSNRKKSDLKDIPRKNIPFGYFSNILSLKRKGPKSNIGRSVFIDKKYYYLLGIQQYYLNVFSEIGESSGIAITIIADHECTTKPSPSYHWNKCKIKILVYILYDIYYGALGQFCHFLANILT